MAVPDDPVFVHHDNRPGAGAHHGLVSAVVMQTGRRTSQQKAVVGAKLTLKDMNSGKKVVYTLVDVRETDASSGKISTVSPVGSALMSRSVGEEIAINVPKGTLNYTIEKIST